ncbi:MAG: DUF1513 domain-containing protein [Hyphomicrobiales bacterium]|nr:DUF1513 domain-containing protein [Hyphomicrobiales bacterium]
MRRRDVLIGLSAGFVAALRAPLAIAAEDELFAAACKLADGSFAAIFYSAERGRTHTLPLPGRGHDVAQRPGSPECVAIARRPGRFAAAFAAGREPVWFASAPGRHFYGHGAFSSDGRLFFTSENDYENARGVIGVRDASAGYRQIGEFSSHGVDPHDVLVTPDGRRLVIANGGIATHPDSGRAALNASHMEASLVYLDARTGDLVEKIVLPPALQKLSIRHLAIAGDRAVFGCQYEGAGEDAPPLVGFHRLGEEPRLVTAGPAQASLRNYVGSIAADASGDIIAASSPRGGVAAFWDARSFRFLGARPLEDVCGAAPAHRGFMITSGTGAAERIDARTIAALATRQDDFAWDNHLTALTV